MDNFKVQFELINIFIYEFWKFYLFNRFIPGLCKLKKFVCQTSVLFNYSLYQTTVNNYYFLI